MASILLIQALFFGDGGLLAYGSNVFNLGFYTCFMAYPIYLWLTRKGLSAKKILAASIFSAVLGLQLGAFSVVLETFLSGKTELPFATFLMLMQPIHLAIGVVEGLVTAAVVTFIWQARPEILERAAIGEALGNIAMKQVFTTLLIAVVAVGGALSWFASGNPDGLEWSIEKTAGTAELESTGVIYQRLAEIQSKTAILPDYGFKAVDEEAVAQTENRWSIIDAGTSVSGIIGGMMTLALAAFTGLIISMIKRKKRKVSA